MQGTIIRLLAVVTLLTLLGPVVPVPTAAVPQDVGMYEENFTAYTYKDYTENADWDIWDGHLTVSLSDAVDQRAPAVTPDGAGGSFVVWKDCRNGNWDIYAQRLDADGSRLWEHDLQVNSEQGMVYSNSSPSLGVGGNGVAVVVWVDERNGDRDIYAQRLDADGNKLWVADLRVNSDSGSASQESSSVAVDGSGNAVVVWDDDRNADRDIYAQRLDASGSKLWAADLRVNSDSGTEHQRSPSIAVNWNGNTVVAWEDERNGDKDVYAQRLGTVGSKLWTADLRVNSDSGTEHQDSLAVAVDGSGNAIVVWEDYRNGSGWDKAWGDDVRVNSDSGTAGQSFPTVGVDESGNAVIAWNDERNGNDDVYAQRLSTSGAKLWASDVQVVYPDFFHLPTGTAQSRAVDVTDDFITEATLTAQYILQGGDVAFHLTNDGGERWAQVIPGVTHVFTTTGSDLRWKATLTTDPIWRHRAPIVEQIRIEYQTISASGDDYEVDDTCAQAQPIAVNGAVQQHTFYQYDDADWVWFDATAGTTYVIQTAHTCPNADTVLELFNACGQPPSQSDDNAFSPGSVITFQAPTSGTYYAKVSQHDPTVYGEGTDYELSVRTQSPAPIVVIVAVRNSANDLESNITFMGDQAYRTFRRTGVPRENIRYLSVGDNRDADQDGHQDVDGAPTWENVRYAVQDWPRERGVGLGVPFYLYLVDHGGTDYYCATGCASGSWVRAEDLNLWLSNLEATTGLDEVNVVIEACYSGAFVDVTTYGPAGISSHGRVVIASTGSRARAFPSERGGYFSDAFFTALGDNADLWTAYVAGRTAAQAAWVEQTPWLDDNGDAIADGSDGLVARGRGLAAFGGGAIPVVDWLEVGEITEGGMAAITAQVRDDVAVVTATVEVYPPGLTLPDTGEGETPELPVDRVELRDDDGDGVYEGVYACFTEAGSYRLVAYAWDNDGNLSLPRETTVGEKRVYLPLTLKNSQNP